MQNLSIGNTLPSFTMRNTNTQKGSVTLKSYRAHNLSVCIVKKQLYS